MKERPILFNSAMVRAILDGSKTQTRRVIKLPHHNPLGQWERTSIGGGKGGRTASGDTVPLQDGIWHTRTGDCLMCQLGQPGDHLWVRENFQPLFADGREHGENSPDWKTGEGYKVTYPATDEIVDWIDSDDNITAKCKPSIHMPRWASRIQLEITGIHVERLQDISEADAKAEGVMQLDAKDFERPMERNKDGWKLCPTCAGTGLHNALGANGGVICDVDCTDCDTHAKLFKHLWNSTGGDWDANPYVWVIEFRRIK